MLRYTQVVVAVVVVVLVASVSSAPQSVKGVDGTERERGKEESDDVAEEIDGDSGRKLLGLPSDLPETPTSADPKTKQETEIISKIESILNKVKEQYSKGNQPQAHDKANSEVHTSQSITDLLKLSVPQENDKEQQEDPVIEEARQRYMSVWNQEADRLNAPYMKVNKAWPELGMVYMPVVTEVTDQIKASESVKEALQVFKDVWESRRAQINTPPATQVEPLLKILNSFTDAWSWAQTTEQHANTPEVGEANEQAQIHQYTNDDASVVAGTKNTRRVDSDPRTDATKGLDSSIEELLRNIFNPKRIQPVFDQSVSSKPKDPLTKLGEKKIMLSCSVVPDVVNDAIASVAVPAADHRPIHAPFPNVRPIQVPSRVGNVRPVRQQTQEQKRIINPVPETRPAPDSAAVLRQDEDRLAVNVPVSHIAYPGLPNRHGMVKKPVVRTDGFPTVSRDSVNVGGIGQYDSFQDSIEDASQSSESHELSHQAHRPPSWMAHHQY